MFPLVTGTHGKADSQQHAHQCQVLLSSCSCFLEDTAIVGLCWWYQSGFVRIVLVLAGWIIYKHQLAQRSVQGI